MINHSTQKSLRILFGVLLGLVASNLTLAERRERLIDSWKPLNYSVAITLNQDLKEITRATADITLSVLKPRTRQLDFDFGEMAIDSVRVNGKRARYTRGPDSLVVLLSQPQRVGARLLVSVSYHGKPKAGLVLSNDKDGKPSAVGDNWPNRLHHWLPSLDHPSAKATVSFAITAPSENLVVANGKFGQVTNSGMTRTWSFTESVPIPPYCIIFAAGQFTEVKAEDQTITPLSYYVPRSDVSFAAKGFSTAAPSLKHFSEIVAPYPYEKLALIVGATQFGGMENSSAIVFASNILSPRPTAVISPTFGIRKGIVEVVAHEIAHQWFGDSVTQATWSDLWLSEGFATYFAGIFVQRHEGETAFRSYMAKAADEALGFEKERRIPLHDKETENLLDLLNGNNYQKGAWVLHMLRTQLGDEIFFRGIRDFYNAHKDGVATSEDLRMSLESASHSDLKAFFASWVYGTGHPIYELSWQWDEQRKVLRLRLKQNQAETVFPNWVPVSITTVDREERVLIKPSSKDFVQEFPLTAAPKSVVLDPDSTVLKELSIGKAA